MHAHVVVIGGGVVGCSVLYHLARAGWRDLILVEEAQLTAGSTWHAAANGNTFNASPLFAWATKRTFDLWPEIEKESGQAIGAHQVGGLMIARTPDRINELARLRGIGKRIGVDYEMLTPDELSNYWPVLNTDTVLGAMYDPNGGHVDPYGLTQAYARAARQRGATVKQNWKVTALTPTPDGGWIVSGPMGEIRAEIIVNAAGLYADEIAKLTGARLPMVNMRHHYLITEPIEAVMAIEKEPPVFRDVDAGVYGRREGGGILFGIYEQDCRDFGFDSMPESFESQLFEPDFDRLEPELEHVFNAVPCIGESGIKSTVHGPFVFTPDVRPLLGWMPGQKNHFAAVGFLAGISMSGGFGQLIAEWIVEGVPHRDLSTCDVLRFGDWAIGDFARARGHDAYRTRYKMHFPNEEISAGRPVRTTPMHERYASMGAHFGFADGWERPNWFAGTGNKAKETPSFQRSEAHDAIARECKHVHTAAGYADLITFANYLVQGPDAETFLRKVLPGRLPKSDGRLSLSPLVNNQGGTLGDVTVLRLGDERFMLVASGAMSRIHLRTILPSAEGLDLEFINRTDTWSGFSIAGPKSREIVQTALGEQSVPAFFQGGTYKLGGTDCVIMRLSYVGEISYEIHCPLDEQTALHDTLLNAATSAVVDLQPFGARAMNAMRIEKGLPRTGDELTIEATPFELGMDKNLDLERSDQYIGREALMSLRRARLRNRLITVIFEETDIDPVGGEPLTLDGNIVGYVSSADFGHRTQQTVAIGFLAPPLCKDGQKVTVHILGREYTGAVSLRCAFDPEGALARS